MNGAVAAAAAAIVVSVNPLQHQCGQHVYLQPCSLSSLPHVWFSSFTGFSSGSQGLAVGLPDRSVGVAREENFVAILVSNSTSTSEIN